jgi:hypothetical protein
MFVFAIEMMRKHIFKKKIIKKESRKRSIVKPISFILWYSHVRGSSMTLDLDYNYLMVHIYTNFRIILEI